MPSPIDDLLARIAQLEREVEIELSRAPTEWRYRIEAGRIRFERDVRLAHDPEFVDYGDARGYHRELPVLRVKLRGNRPADEG